MDRGECVLRVYDHYARQGLSLAQAALAGVNEFRVWDHHPAQDAIDHGHRTRFYYHAHGDHHPAFRGEHGHFHVFAQSGEPGQTEHAFAHLVAISIDPRGTPLGLFTTNGWVTGEHRMSLSRQTSLLKSFRIELKGRLAPVARWIDAVIRWQQPLIAQLMRERESRLRAHPQGPKAAWSDTRLHVTSRKALPHFWSSLIKEST